MDLFKEFDNWLDEQESIQKQSKKCFIGCRGYGHFDSKIGIKRCRSDKKIRQEVCNPASLKRHKFWPFIRQDQKTRRYTQDIEKKLKIKVKLRKIMYASHMDAIILSFYASLLKRNYEDTIDGTSACESVIGYRRIPLTKYRNKSNIDFSKDVFEIIRTTNDSVLFCMDIKDFFGNIEHCNLYNSVMRFGKDIPEDNLRLIIKCVSNYRYVFRNDVENKLGKDVQKWTDSRKYNKLIRDTNLIHKNKQKKGIPQGSPISDILANIYLYDFDVWLAEKVSQYQGIYRRYSDDILILVPASEAESVYSKICEKIEGEDFNLEIGKDKTEAFYIDAPSQTFKDITKKYVAKYSKNKESAQYLGFNMNLNNISVRPGTVAKHYRKETQKIKAKLKKKNKKVVNRQTPSERQSKFGKKYGYLKLSAKKTGNSIPKQLRKVRKRTQKMWTKAKNSNP